MKTTNISSNPANPPKPDRLNPNLTPEVKRKVAVRLCDLIAKGAYFTVFHDDILPEPDVLRRWALEDPVIHDTCITSLHTRIEWLTEQILAIVDARPSTCKDARGNTRIDPSYVAHMKLCVETKRWAISTLTSQLTHHTSRSASPQTHTSQPNSTPITPPAPMHQKSPESPNPAAPDCAQQSKIENRESEMPLPVYAPNLPSPSVNPTPEPLATLIEAPQFNLTTSNLARSLRFRQQATAPLAPK